MHYESERRIHDTIADLEREIAALRSDGSKRALPLAAALERIVCDLKRAETATRSVLPAALRRVFP